MILTMFSNKTTPCNQEEWELSPVLLVVQISNSISTLNCLSSNGHQ